MDFSIPALTQNSTFWHFYAFFDQKIIYAIKTRFFCFDFLPKKNFKMAKKKSEIICEPDQKNSKRKSYKQARVKLKKCFEFRRYWWIIYKFHEISGMLIVIYWIYYMSRTVCIPESNGRNFLCVRRTVRYLLMLVLWILEKLWLLLN